MTPDRLAFVAAVLASSVVTAHLIVAWFARRVRRATAAEIARDIREANLTGGAK